MNKLLPIALGLFLVVSNTTVPATAVTSSAKCDQTLKSVKKSLSGMVGFRVAALGNQGQPQGRTKVLYITFKNRSEPSEENRKAIATRVIRNCSQVASVVFNTARKDGSDVYGIKDNQIIQFTCYEERGEKKPVWGEHYCA
jgi:hypothetical protein